MEGSKARLGEVALRFLGLCGYLRSHLQGLKGPWIWMRVVFVCEFASSVCRQCRVFLSLNCTRCFHENATAARQRRSCDKYVA